MLADEETWSNFWKLLEVWAAWTEETSDKKSDILLEILILNGQISCQSKYGYY